MAHDVFISYPSADKATADAVVNALESHGLRCWFAPRDIAPGTDWAAAIIRGIQDSSLMVLVFSEATNASEHILREVRQAADNRIPIVPFRTTLETPNSTLSYYIGGTHWLDALTSPLEEHLGQLVETAQQILGDRPRSPASPKGPPQDPASRVAPPARSAQTSTPRRRLWKPLLALGVAAVVAVALAVVGSNLLSGDSESASGTTVVPNASEATPTTVSATAPEPSVAPTQPSTPLTEPIVVCQVNTQFGSFDSPFFASSWKGVQAAVGAGFASDDSRFQEGPSIDDSVRTITTFVQEDCSLIVTVGALLVDVTEQFAIDNPEILFVAVDAIYDDPPPNLRAVHFRVDEAAFLAGYLAAGTTRSGVVGTFGGYDIPEVTDFMDGFLWGVQHFNEVNATSVRVVGWDSSGSGAFIGNFEIAADGRLMTETLIADGADIVFPVAGLAGLGSTEAARAAGDVAVIGADTDAFYADPAGADLYLTSVMKNLDVGVFDAIADAAVGTLDNVPFIGTLDNGGVNISPLHAFEGAVPANLPADLEVLKLGIINGEVSVGPVDRVALTWIHNPATDHYYSLTGIGLSWEELETLAQEHGGYLVSIGDVAEEEWVYSYFGSTVFWIGLTDRAVEGEWMWTSGEPATYLNWCPGEPSDAGGGSGPEDAAYAIPSSQCWNDEGVWVTEFLVVEDGTLIPSYPGVIELDGPPD